MKTNTKNKITTSLISTLLGALFAVPAFYMVEDKILFGKYIIDFQIKYFGCYFLTSSFMIVLLIEFLIVGFPLFIIAVLVRKVTGKTIVELIKNSERC